MYFRQYGAQNFLFYCDLGNILITVGLWAESRFILSWQAVSLLLFQSLYAIDLIGAFVFRRHFIGGTEYMFDPTIPLLVRLLGLYHLFVPPLLVWLVRRLGCDPSASKWATLEAWIIVPINFFWRPHYNVNFARGIAHEQHLMPPWLYLLGYLIVVPLVIYWPTLLLLRWWTRNHFTTEKSHLSRSAGNRGSQTEVTMIKLVYCITKKPGLSEADFSRYWQNEHAPIGARIPGLRKFVQSHRINVPGDKHAPDYDGMAELWFDNIDALLNARKSREWKESTEDEAIFIDHTKVAYFVSEEHVILDKTK